MKFYLISDNIDTLIGMRLSGIDGVVVHTEKEVRKTLEQTMRRKDVAVVLMTDSLTSLCPELIMDYKMNRKQPLIVGIPDRHGNGRTGDSITGYVRDAIGIKLD
ncbi:MAG: V-type ATP synthase subunit F [Lachnospiraceae bacterium]|nr:V-type ATP synthase subunit F [Lachnospiraceae bacterium]